MITYIIIGLIIIIYSSIRLLVKGVYTVEEMLCTPDHWLAIFICVVLWPGLVAWALYDAIKEVKEERPVE